MIVSIIVAYDMERGIGHHEQVPWRLPGDMRRFKMLTMGHHIIMGRKTWESIGRALPGRTSLVISRQSNYQAPGALVLPDLEPAIRYAQAAGDSEVFVIGGAQIYKQALPLAQRIYATLVLTRKTADAWFPPLNPAVWQETQVIEQEPSAGDEFRYLFIQMEKVNA
jgi:dihydrofolate reductase